MLTLNDRKRKVAKYRDQIELKIKAGNYASLYTLKIKIAPTIILADNTGFPVSKYETWKSTNEDSIVINLLNDTR